MYNPKWSSLGSWLSGSWHWAICILLACGGSPTPKMSSQIFGCRERTERMVAANVATPISRDSSSRDYTKFLPIRIFSFSGYFLLYCKRSWHRNFYFLSRNSPISSFSGVDVIVGSQQDLSVWRELLQIFLWCRMLYLLSAAHRLWDSSDISIFIARRSTEWF